MTQEEHDRVIYDIIIDIWEAYRKSTKSANAKPFNDVFIDLYDRFDSQADLIFTDFIARFGVALTPSVNRAVQRGVGK